MDVLPLSGAIPNLPSFLRRMSVKPPEEEKGIFKRKKTTEPVMVFSFSAEEVAGKENRGKNDRHAYFRCNA